jgi:uncharacterized protein YqgC (DUF456 family)
MTWLEITYFIIALLIMIVGLLGVILPVIPGIVIIFVSTLLYGSLTGFETISVRLIVVFGVLTALTYLLDYLATAFGVKKMGGSFAGASGAVIGMILGFLIPGVGLFGFVIGAFIGAFIFELMVVKETRIALKAGLGSFLGFLLGGFIKFVIGSIMIGVFIYYAIFA